EPWRRTPVIHGSLQGTRHDDPTLARVHRPGRRPPAAGRLQRWRPGRGGPAPGRPGHRHHRGGAAGRTPRHHRRTAHRARHRVAVTARLPGCTARAAGRLLLAGCNGGDQDAGGRRQEGPVTVTTAVVQPAAWRDSIEALGTARANESVVLTAKVTETVEAVNFEDGDHVSAGDVLVDLSGRAEVAALEEAQAEYKEARQQYERQAELV